MKPAASTSSDDRIERFVMLCLRCDRPVVTRTAWIGREVQCPHCASVLRVPSPAQDGTAVRANGPDLSPRRFFNFACPRCGCLLEGHTGMSGQIGTCPTCASRFSVPHLRPGSNRPERARPIDDETNDPTPMHTYAASGDQAPRIVRDGEATLIECPRCAARNDIDADRCCSCAAPFTMDAAPTVGRMNRDSRAVASVVLGVIALLLSPTFLPAVLAIWFGILAVSTPHAPGRSIPGMLGIGLGVLSIGAGVLFWVYR